MTAMATPGIERGSERFMAKRALAWLAAAAPAAAAGSDAGAVIDLASDELDQPTAEHIVQATIDALNRGETHYTDRVGIIPLRQALAARIAAEDGLDYDYKGEVLICGGGREALFVATQMIIEPGDEVIVPDPALGSFAEGVRLAGGVPVPVATAAAHGFALRADAVRAAITPRTRVILFASPNAPTGGVTTGGDLAAIAALAREYNLLVIWDETYRTFAFDGVLQDNIATLPGMRERTAIVGSFSARYAMSGWRIGYVVAPARLLRPVAMMKQALTICSAAPRNGPPTPPSAGRRAKRGPSARRSPRAARPRSPPWPASASRPRARARPTSSSMCAAPASAATPSPTAPSARPTCASSPAKHLARAAQASSASPSPAPPRASAPRSGG